MLTSKDLYSQLQQKHFIIAGPCVLEDFYMAKDVASVVKESCEKLGLVPIFKSSYDKANRSSIGAYRGLGIKKGLDYLAKIKEDVGIAILTDIHTTEEANIASEVADILQIPALLCRQTDLLVAAAKTHKIINVKKGQFLAPSNMKEVKEKINDADNAYVLLTERGTTFGYNNLVVDFRSFAIMQELGAPVVFDATHSVQLPGALGASSGGESKYVALLAKAAAAAGVNGIFMETHPNPTEAKCDGPNSIELAAFPELVEKILQIWQAGAK